MVKQVRPPRQHQRQQLQLQLQLQLNNAAMIKNWLPIVRKAHLYLGVSFAPLLILFLVTGAWQTLAPQPDQDAAKTWLQSFMEPLTHVHTDDFFPPEKKDHNHWGFKILVGLMAFGLVLTTFMGIYLAFRLTKKSWPIIVALVLGVIIPILLLWIDL